MSRDICQPAKMQAEIFFCLPHDPTPSKGLAWLSSCPSLFSFILQKFSERPLRSDTWDAWMKGRERFHLVKIEVCGISVKQGGGWETLQESQKGLQSGWWSWKDGVPKMTMVGASFCGSGACQREPQSAPGNRMQTGRTAHMCFRNCEIASTYCVVVKVTWGRRGNLGAW